MTASSWVNPRHTLARWVRPDNPSISEHSAGFPLPTAIRLMELWVVGDQRVDVGVVAERVEVQHGRRVGVAHQHGRQVGRGRLERPAARSASRGSLLPGASRPSRIISLILLIAVSVSDMPTQILSFLDPLPVAANGPGHPPPAAPW